MTRTPKISRLFSALDATWAPAEIRRLGSWTLRKGLGGGKRVSATTTDSPVNVNDIVAAEAEMCAMSQDFIFMIRKENNALDVFLHARDYTLIDPVLMLCAPVSEVAKIDPDPLEAIPCEQPLALTLDLWKHHDIGTARIDVMRRTKTPKTYLCGRHKNRSVGAAFVAVDGEIAMLHALVVAPIARHAGVARSMLGRAAIWSAEQGATTLAVATTGENLPAQKLFTGVGMQIAARYHYRMK